MTYTLLVTIPNFNSHYKLDFFSFTVLSALSESVYCTLNCPNTHTKNKNSVCIGIKWCAVNTLYVPER